MVAEQLIRIIWGAAPIPASLPAALKGAVIVGDFLFSQYRLLLLAVVAAVLAGIWYLLQRTAFGCVVRAGIQQPAMVAALGLRLRSDERRGGKECVSSCRSRLAPHN